MSNIVIKSADSKNPPAQKVCLQIIQKDMSMQFLPYAHLLFVDFLRRTGPAERDEIYCLFSSHDLLVVGENLGDVAREIACHTKKQITPTGADKCAPSDPRIDFIQIAMRMRNDDE